MGKIYDSPTWGTVVGRVESDGIVYDGVGMFSKLIGRVDSGWRVYDNIKMFGKLVGHVASDGKVYTEGFLGELVSAVLKATATFMTALVSQQVALAK